jgi:hypothetical protein
LAEHSHTVQTHHSFCDTDVSTNGAFHFLSLQAQEGIMRRFLVPMLVMVFVGLQTLSAQTLNGRFVTSLYGWERADDATGASSQHLRGYETMQLNFGTDDISFHTYMQGSTDFRNEMANDPALRLFNAYLHFKNIADLADVKLGRQAVFAGVNYGTIDGALVRVRPMNGMEVMAYGGGLTPPSQRTDFFQDVDHNWQIGAQVLLFVIPDVKLGLSYMNRHRTSTPFAALRLDPLGSLVQTDVDFGSRANQYGSLTATYAKERWWVFGRYDYDFNFERTSRAEVAANWQATPDLGFMVNLAHREPVIAWNSYFSLFEAEANQEAVLGVDYRLHPRLSLHARIATVLYDGEEAVRASLGASNKYASVMYTKDVSYDGDLDGFNLQFTYPLMSGKVVPHVGMVFSSYALGENLEKTSTWAAIAGTMVRPLPKVSVDLQCQYITNRIYSSDIRIFARVNYWFAHTFGLETGGAE